jgi:Na+-transporting NADH:ubiquinone oxidoreductase subunit NqrB
MDDLFALIASPTVLAGVVGGLALAMLFHWLAPSGTDTVSAGAWFVGLGALAGFFWQWRFRQRTKE